MLILVFGRMPWWEGRRTQNVGNYGSYCFCDVESLNHRRLLFHLDTYTEP